MNQYVCQGTSTTVAVQQCNLFPSRSLFLTFSTSNAQNSGVFLPQTKVSVSFSSSLDTASASGVRIMQHSPQKFFFLPENENHLLKPQYTVHLYNVPCWMLTLYLPQATNCIVLFVFSFVFPIHFWVSTHQLRTIVYLDYIFLFLFYKVQLNSVILKTKI